MDAMTGNSASILALLFVALQAANAPAQQPLPTLRYDPPPNFHRSAITPSDDYSSNEFNTTVFYPFRPFNGNIEQAFPADDLARVDRSAPPGGPMWPARLN
jgi:hypothetical protein